MYKILIGLFLSVLCLQAKCQMQFDEGSFSEVLAKAKQEKRMVFMDCYTSWCGPCKMMVQDVFSQEDVGQFMNTRFVNAQALLDEDELCAGAVGRELAKKYQVKVYPTFLILNEDGEVIHKMVGGMKAEEFLQNVQNGIGEHSLYSYEKRYADGERDPQFVYSYIETLARAFMKERMEEVLHEYWGTLTDQEKSCKENWMLVKRFVKNPALPEYKYLLEHKKDFDAAVSKDSVDRKIYDDLFPLIVNDCNEIIFHDKVNAAQLLETYEVCVTRSGIAGQDYLLDIVEFTKVFLSGDLKKALKMYDKKFSRLDSDARFDVTLQLNGMLIRKGDAKMCKRGLELIEKTMKDCGWSVDDPLFAAVVSGLKDKFKDDKDE